MRPVVGALAVIAALAGPWTAGALRAQDSETREAESLDSGGQQTQDPDGRETGVPADGDEDGTRTVTVPKATSPLPPERPLPSQRMAEEDRIRPAMVNRSVPRRIHANRGAIRNDKAASSKRKPGSGAPEPAVDPFRQPVQMPWEAAVERLYRTPQGRPVPGLAPTPTDPARSREEELMRLLGLPPNVKIGLPTELETASPQLPTDAEKSRLKQLDTDRDGYISRSEYVGAGMSRLPVGTNDPVLQSRVQSRLMSRFRGADADRDGRVSLGEMGTVRNRRF